MATVVVQARRGEGRRRAGRFWPATPVEVDVDEATLALLREDPQLLVRAPREHDHATAVDGDTVESLRAELLEATRAINEARAAHAADLRGGISRALYDALVGDHEALRAAHAECDARFSKAASLANDTVSKWSAAVAELEAVTAERDALRKQVTALEEAATAPSAPKNEKKK